MHPFQRLAMMKSAFALFVAALLSLAPAPAPAQLGLLGPAAAGTGEYFSQQLKNRIEELNELANSVPPGMLSVIRELDVRLRALAEELDRLLGNRINESFNRLDLSQQTFLRGVQDTLESSKEAINQVRSGAFRDARRMLVEADVSAYNVLYAIPCRDKVPRVLLSSPEVARVSGDDLEVELLGNFLNLGDAVPKVSFEGQQLRVTDIDENTLSFVIPGSVLSAQPNAKRILSFDVEGLQQETANWFFRCWRIDSEFRRPVKVSFTVLPLIEHRIDVQFSGTLRVEKTVQNVINGERVQLGGGCSTSSGGSNPHRAGTPNVRLANARIQKHSEICGSTIGTPVYIPGSSTELLVPFYLRGCGRGRAGDCKGRARASYSVWADGLVSEIQALDDVLVTRTLFNRGSAAFDVPGNGDANRKVVWKVRVTTTEGAKTPVVVDLTADRQFASGYSAAPGTNGGAIVVNLPNPVDEP